MENKLFNKDIEKQCILIDTQDLTRSASQRSHTDYKIKFNDDGTNNTAGYGGVFKNVIGFRLKKAIIRNDPVNIDSSNSTIVLNDGGTSGSVFPETFNLLPAHYGFYNGTALATLLTTDTSWRRFKGGVNDAVAPFDTCTFDTATNKLIFLPSATFNFTTHKDVARLLGFNGDTTTASVGGSDFPIDLSFHYVDVVVNEIPYIACKKNASGRSLIDRIPITVGLGALQYYSCDPADFHTQNYFFPITLSELNIKLYTDHDNVVKSSDEQHSFEFEITMLKSNKFR